ncbi:hypothetical protein WR25_23396 [Diploscapter pachys]|uniref:Uncharacterized protein n=1 Tax=Diploscapter pachys TaxID=2018661 RepID=A0A2A2M1U7_9BILA|nr:hypothetical protein WR25_23396 [Diploscapter pachys]
MRRRAFGLRPVPSLSSRPFGFNPSRLRACGAARFACLQGKALRAIPAALRLAPLERRRTGLRRIGRAGAYGWAAAAASWLSASLISTAVLHSSALAILKISASVGMCSPRSTLPMCERSMPARCASDSCAIPRSVRSARTAAPKACASSASKVVAPAGRPGWTERFCMDRSVKSQDN